MTQRIPSSLALALYLVEFSSLWMLSAVWFQWKKRQAQGFRWGDLVRNAPLTGRELAQWVGLLIVVYGQFLLAGMILKEKGVLGGETSEMAYMLLGQAVLYFVFLGLLHVFFRRTGETWTQAFGFRASRLRNAAATAAVGLAAILIPLQIVAWGARLLFQAMNWSMEPQPIIQFLLETQNLGIRTALAALAILGAPVTEEILFRGLLYPCLKKSLGFRHALWINALLFSVFHGHPSSAPALFLLGIAFTLIYEWRGNLGACIFLHAGFNALSLALLFTLKDALL